MSTLSHLATAVRQPLPALAATIARAAGESGAPTAADGIGDARKRALPDGTGSKTAAFFARGRVLVRGRGLENRWRVLMASSGLARPSQGPVRRLALLALTIIALLALTAAPAFAAAQYPFLGQLPPLSSNNLGLAVDGQNGNALVADSVGNQAVVKIFDPSGSLLTTLDGSSTPAGTFGGNGNFQFIAADDSSGRFYATDKHTTPQVVDRFDSSGAYVCQITGAGSLTASATECDNADPGTPSGDLGDLGPLAVDQASGDLYAYDATTHLIDVFDSSGKYLRQIDGSGTPAGSFGGRLSLAVDDHTGHLLVADGFQSVVYVFDAATGTYLASWDGSATANPPGTPAGAFGFVPSVAADDSTGDVYVGSPQFAVVDHLDSSGNYLGQITGIPGGSSFSQGDGVAVAVAQPGHRLYVLRQSTQLVDIFGDQPVTVPDATTGAASPVATTTATLNGTVNPDSIQLTSCHFDFVPDSQFQGDGYQSVTAAERAPCVPDAASIPADSSDHAVSADLSGLKADTTYHFRLDAANANGAGFGADQTLTTLPVPVIDAAFASNLTPTEADLNAEINPRGSQLTDCHFDWGTDISYANSIPCSPVATSIPADSADHLVTTHLSGLTQNATYHWRVIATGTNGITTSADHTFIYPTTGGGLPDGRAYEMVTPPQKNGALIGNIFDGIAPHFSEDGSRLILTSIQCFAGAGSCPGNRGIVGSPYQFSRTSTGWLTAPLSPPATQFDIGTGVNASPDAGTALFGIPTPPVGQDDWYVREPDGSFVDIGPAAPPVPRAVGNVRVDINAATADFSHLAWHVDQPARFWPFDSTTGGGSVYEYDGTGNTQPALVGVSGGAGSTDLISVCATDLGASSGGAGAMSADGRTLYFTALGPCSGGSGANAGTPVPANALYARIGGSQTVPISQPSPADCGVPSGCQGSPPGDAFFEGASDDGSKAFFTDTQQLTDGASEDSDPGDTAAGFNCHSTTGANGCNLYLYDFANPAGHQLIDVSAGDSSGDGPRVQGVIATSADGSHAYFVAKGRLTGAPNARGQVASDGANNLYAFERDSAHPDGHLAFVAGLLGSDRQEWQNGAGDPANVTPDGRFLVFTSAGALTPDTTSSGAQQVFRYDAQTGDLTRVSIGEGGFNDNGNVAVSACGLVQCPQDAYIPRMQFQAGPTRRDPTMSHDGAYVFFQSPLALTPHALDQVPIGIDTITGLTAYAQNVYEWHGGHVHLISDGRDAATAPGGACNSLSSVCLVGTDATGSNVFFSSSDQLVPQDTDTQLDYYDARVGGGFPFTPPPAPCNGDNCKPAPSGTPPVPTAASVSFNGPGNAAPGAATAKLKILSRVAHGSTFLLKLSVPDKGRITITGTGIKTVRKSLSKGGTYTLRVTLTPKEKQLLRHKRRLKLRLRVSYAPARGASASVTFSITDKA